MIYVVYNLNVLLDVILLKKNILKVLKNKDKFHLEYKQLCNVFFVYIYIYIYILLIII